MYCNVASTLTILQHGSLVRLLNPISTSQESFPLTSTAFGMLCSLPSQTSLPSWVAYTTVLSWATLNLLAAVCFAGLFFSILPLDIQPSKGLSLVPWVMLTSKIKKISLSHIFDDSQICISSSNWSSGCHTCISNSLWDIATPTLRRYLKLNMLKLNLSFPLDGPNLFMYFLSQWTSPATCLPKLIVLFVSISLLANAQSLILILSLQCFHTCSPFILLSPSILVYTFTVFCWTETRFLFIFLLPVLPSSDPFFTLSLKWIILMVSSLFNELILLTTVFEALSHTVNILPAYEL